MVNGHFDAHVINIMKASDPATAFDLLRMTREFTDKIFTDRKEKSLTFVERHTQNKVI